MMGLRYKLDVFEGPLDLLLHLIDKNEVDIYNIPIRKITDQYMAYLRSMQELDLDLTSEFLLMAAMLLSIKSKMLLPKPPKIELELEEDEGEDPRAELVRKLIEYRKYKGIAGHLREKELERSKIFTREAEDLSGFVPELRENPVRGIPLADLMIAFGKALKRAEKRNRVAQIRRDEISVKDRIVEMVEMLKTGKGRVRFSSFFFERTREEIVTTFLALLELMKMKRVTCFQDGLFDEIVIVYKGDGRPDGFERDAEDELERDEGSH